MTKLEGLRVSDTGYGGRPQALEDFAEAELVLYGTTEEERLKALEGAWGEIAAAFGLTRPDRETVMRQIRGFEPRGRRIAKY